MYYSLMFFIVYAFKGLCRTRENCKSLVLQDKCNIEIVLFPVLAIAPQCKVSKGAKIRNLYNQVPHLTQDTNGKVTNSQLDTTNENQEFSPFPAGDHKAQINRHASNGYTMGCPPVRGDNPRALARESSYVQVDKHGITILYHLHQCRPCTSRDISC